MFLPTANPDEPPIYAAPAGFLLMVLCWLFWRMDSRNRVLLHRSSDMLKAIEKSIPIDIVPEDQQLFIQIEAKTKVLEESNRAISRWSFRRWWHAPLTFYRMFEWIFIVFGVVGFFIMIAVLFLPGQQSSTSQMPPQQNFYIGGQPVPPTLEHAPNVK